MEEQGEIDIDKDMNVTSCQMRRRTADREKTIETEGK